MKARFYLMEQTDSTLHGREFRSTEKKVRALADFRANLKNEAIQAYRIVRTRTGPEALLFYFVNKPRD